MANYIGPIKEVDHYIGGNLIVAKYIGETKYFGAYNDISGELPLIFQSRVEHNLKNYRIHGTSEGAGVETENLFDKNAKNISNGYVSDVYLKSDGTTSDSTACYITEYIAVTPSTTYTLSRGTTSGSSLSICEYDANKEYVNGTPYNNKTTITMTTGQNTTYIRASIYKVNAKTTMFTPDPTAPASYIPYGYSIPLTVTSGAQSQDYPLYIGSSKLGAEEYLDFGEQKVYKYSEPLKIYGWHVDPSISDPDNTITYLGDAVGKTPAAMGASTFSYGGWADAFFMPKPCMVKSDGTVDYYLDPNDYTKKADGTASDVADLTYDGNAMMEWPLIWYKYEGTSTAGEGYFYVANAKIDDSYHCWCNYDADGNIINHFYTAIYNGTGTTKLRSMSGVATTNAKGCGGTSGSTEVTRATANNTTDKTEWYTDVFCDRMLINGLLILISKSLNSQAKFGNGLVTGSETGKNGYTTGNLNDKGLFWGDTTNQTAGVKVFGMENWWGLVYRRTAGCVGLADGSYAIKQTWSTVDGSTTTGYNSRGDGYIAAGTRPGGSGQYVKQMTYANDCYLPLLASEATSTTYYCDYWYTNNMTLAYLLVGGSARSGFIAGLSAFILSNAFGDASWTIGACLSLKPLAKQPYSPPLTPTDPPAPFPAINTYKGENTLSTTETLGEITIKGRIRELTYRRVEYLKSTGTQYIQTDIVPLYSYKSELRIKFGSEIHQIENKDYTYIFGISGAAALGVYCVQLDGSSGNIIRFRDGYYSTDTSITGINPVVEDTLIMNRPTSFYGNASLTTNAAIEGINPPVEPIVIFGLTGVSAGAKRIWPFKRRDMLLYEFKIYDSNGSLLNNLIPVEREDGELGLLDTITNKFYTNAGTGTFEKGAYIEGDINDTQSNT